MWSVYKPAWSATWHQSNAVLSILCGFSEEFVKFSRNFSGENLRNSSAQFLDAPFLTFCDFLRQEYENKILPWLWSFGIFIFFRFFAFLFFAIVNDLIFFYNIAMTMLWIVIISVSIYGWLVVYSLYLELSDLTKLEDLAHLRVSNIALPYRFQAKELLLSKRQSIDITARNAFQVALVWKLFNVSKAFKALIDCILFVVLKVF